MAQPALVPRPPALLRLPAWARRQHPIVREEVRRWGRLRFSLFNKGGWLAAGGVFLLVLFPGVCVGAALLMSRPPMETSTIIGVAGGSVALAAWVISGLVHGLTGLAASIVGATLIARDREEQRWPYVRVTPLTSIEIVGGKLASLLYLLARPMHLAVALRLFALFAGAATAILLLTVGGMTWEQLLATANVARELLPAAPVGTLLVGLVGFLDVLVAVLLWVAQPYFTGLYNALVGLLASTLVRSRGLAIGAAFVIHLGLWLVVYTPIQQLTYVLLASTGAINPVIGLGNATTILVAATLQGGLFIALQVAVMAGCFYLSVRRVDRLGE